MNWLSAPERRGKLVLGAAILLMWSLLFLGFRFLGYEETWRLWQVPVLEPRFIDFRVIPASAESFRQGFEPTVENPADPMQRLFNYPAFWRLFFYTNISMADTDWIVVVMLVAYFLAVTTFAQAPAITDVFFILLVVFSPAAMLLYERGNVDLFVFSICVAALFAGFVSSGLGAALVAFGMVVKLYPLFGLVMLVRESKSRFWQLTVGVLVFLFVYGALTFPSQLAAWRVTPRGESISYGTFVLVTRLGDELIRWFPGLFSIGQWELFFEVLCLLLIGLAALLALRDPAPLPGVHARNLAAFRMGAAIYVGTFLLGNNWDYRLAFLVLVIPQLMEWFRSADPKIRIWSLVMVLCIFASCWHFVLDIDLPFLPLTDFADRNFVFDEIMNWSLVPGFVYLLIRSGPDWLKQDAGALTKYMAKLHWP